MDSTSLRFGKSVPTPFLGGQTQPKSPAPARWFWDDLCFWDDTVLHPAMYHDVNTDRTDPVVIVKIDISNAFNEGDRRTTICHTIDTIAV